MEEVQPLREEGNRCSVPEVCSLLVVRNRSQDGAGREGQASHQGNLGRVEEDSKDFELVVPQLDIQQVVGYLVDIAAGHTGLGRTTPAQLLPDLR